MKEIHNQFAGCALSIILDFNQFEKNCTYRVTSGNSAYSTHTAEGDIVHGISVFIRPYY